MATSYQRLRFLWGAVDWQAGSGTPYSSGQTLAVGADANIGTGKVAARRAVVVLERAIATPADDVLNFHFDFMKLTAGVPDDAWVTGDFTTLETAIKTFWTTAKAYCWGQSQLSEIRWYRCGYGVAIPNPAVRIAAVSPKVIGTGASAHSPQQACTVTFRTASRRSWGRTYLPYDGGAVGADQRPSNANVDTIATAAHTLIGTAAAADFVPVVCSMTKHAALAIESVECDNVLDVVRRRRFKHTTYRKILP